MPYIPPSVVHGGEADGSAHVPEKIMNHMNWFTFPVTLTPPERTTA